MHMNAIRSVFAAFTNLAASVNALSGVIDGAAGRLRQQLALDEVSAPAVIEHQPPASDADEPPSTKGRKARTTAV
jgi:hypothetical protein